MSGAAGDRRVGRRADVERGAGVEHRSPVDHQARVVARALIGEGLTQPRPAALEGPAAAAGGIVAGRKVAGSPQRARIRACRYRPGLVFT